DLLEQAGLPHSRPAGSDEWEEVSLRAAVDALPPPGSRWDFLVVDEAQDLTKDDWFLVEELSRHGGLWAFHDPAQRFWSDRSIPRPLFAAPFLLPQTHRCAQAILALAQACGGAPLEEAVVRQALADNTIRIEPCPSGSVTERVAREIDRLRGAGLDAGDIAVISLRGRDAESAGLGRSCVAAHDVGAADQRGIAD